MTTSVLIVPTHALHGRDGDRGDQDVALHQPPAAEPAIGVPGNRMREWKMPSGLSVMSASSNPSHRRVTGYQASRRERATDVQANTLVELGEAAWPPATPMRRLRR